MAALVQVLLLGFMFIVALSGVLNVALPSSIPWQGTLFRTFLFIFIIGIPLILLRRGYFRGSVVLIIAMLLVLETYAVISTNLRSIAETLAFFTLAIILAGSLLSGRALVITFFISASALILGVAQESDPVLREDSVVIAANFFLLNGLIGLLLYRFGVTLRAALHAAQGRETHLQNEILIRKKAEAALQHSTEQCGKFGWNQKGWGRVRCSVLQYPIAGRTLDRGSPA